MNIKPVIAYFSNFWKLNQKEIDFLVERADLRLLKKKVFVLEKGQVCNHFIFVVKGCLKMHKADDKGRFHNLQFASENNWISDYGSFYNDEPSELFIESLEPTEIIQFEKNNVFELYDNHAVFDRNFRIIIENAFIEQQKRILQTISSTAEERYLYFIKKYPHLLNRISHVQIASYIGVTPEFLSQVRKKMI